MIDRAVCSYYYARTARLNFPKADVYDNQKLYMDGTL